MTNSTSVSVGHGPGTPRNEGTAKDLGTATPDSNHTEADATQERGAAQQASPKPAAKKPQTQAESGAQTKSK